MVNGVELATAYVSLVVEGSKIPKGVKESLKGVDGAAAKSGQTAGQAYAKRFAGSAGLDKAGKTAGSRFTEGLRSSLGKGTALVGGFFAADKAVEFFKGAIDGASDLNEAGTKINAIFGKSGAMAVQRFASIGAQALGQTKLDVLDAASNFGTFGKAAGLAGQPLAKFSTGFASLSTDLASFYNTSPEQAVEAIGAALRGEAEPIRQYGVLLDDATLRQEALRLGLTKTTKEALTPQQKVLAAQAAIYKQTKDAQGDFQRTSGGLANQQRILSATFKDTQAQLGTKLLPVVVKGATGLNQFIQGVQKGTGAGGAFADVARDVGSAVKPVAGFVSTAAKGFSALPGPVKSTAIEAGLLALVLPRLRAGLGGVGGGLVASSAKVKQFRAEMTYAETRTAATSAATAKLGGAARSAAGVGGILALSAASKTSSASLKNLSNIGGGALLGFSVGGPVGAAVGGVAGAIYAMAKNTKSAGSAFKVTKGDAEGLAASLDKVTGAAKQGTRELLLQKFAGNGALKQAQSVGLSGRTLVDATLGDPRAIGATKAAVGSLTGQLSRMTTAYKQLQIGAAGAGAGVDPDAAESARKRFKQLRTTIDALKSTYGGLGDSVAKSGAKQRIAAAQVATLGKAYRNVPAKVTSQIKLDGAPRTLGELQSLAKQYNLTPKQIQTTANLLDFDISTKKANALRDAALGVPKGTTTRATTPGAPGAKKAMDQVTAAAQRLGKQHPAPSVTARTSLFRTEVAKALNYANSRSATIPIKAGTAGFGAAVASAVGAASQRSVTIPVKKRAKGGPVGPDGPYWVGEHGPEMVTFDRKGYVTPNHKLASQSASSLTPVSSGSSTMAGANFTLVLDDGTPLTGFIQEIADGSVHAAAALATQGR